MTTSASTTHRLPDELTLFDPDGAPVALPTPASGDLMVVQLVRYFGCLPCQDWLVELDRLAPGLAARGVTAAAVGGSADYQAQWLREERGVTMPLYLDPEHAFRDAVDMTRPLGLRMANPKGAVAYARSMRRGYRPQKITQDTVRTPGVVIIDSDRQVVWRHEGTRIGDYPDHQVVLDALDQHRGP